MENISKIVISKNDGVVLGYVLDIVLTNFQKVGYVVVEEETENEYILNCKDISSISDKFILIEDVGVLEFSSTREPSILGLEVMDENGFSFGQVQCLKFQKNKLEKIITKNCEISTKFIKKIGKNVIFLNFKRKKRRILQKSFPKVNNLEIDVKIQKSPEKINLSANFFVGKICLQDVFGYNNERIASKGMSITKAIVDKAKQHDKLNQLFFAIKR